MFSKLKITSKFFAGSLLAVLVGVSVFAWQVAHEGSSTQIDAEPKIGAATASIWTELPDIKNARFEASAVQYKDDVYAFNGFGLGIKVEPTVEKLDADTLTWSVISASSVAKGNAVTHNGIVLNGNEVWLIGGRVGNHPGAVTSKVWKLNLDSRVWTAGPELPVAGAAGGAALVDDRIHWFGGIDTAALCDVDHHFVYDLNNPNDGWRDISSTAPMPVPRNHFATVVLDGLIYAMGGQFTHDGCGAGTPDTELSHVFDPNTNTWDQIASLPAVQSHTEPSTFVHEGAIYMIGGATRGTTVFRYDPSRDEWDSVAQLPQALLAPVARVLNGELIVSSGGAPSITPSSKTYKTSMAPLLLSGEQDSQDADESSSSPDSSNDDSNNDDSSNDDSNNDDSNGDDSNNDYSSNDDSSNDDSNSDDSSNDDSNNDDSNSDDSNNDDSSNDDSSSDDSSNDDSSSDDSSNDDSSNDNSSNGDTQDPFDEVDSSSSEPDSDAQNSSGAEADSSHCDYSDADANSGWGWDPVALVSCLPRTVVETEGKASQTPVDVDTATDDGEPSDTAQPIVIVDDLKSQADEAPMEEETDSTLSSGGGSADKQWLLLLLMVSGLRKGLRRQVKGAS